ncbi:MAG TPA: hypothetical protein VK914_09660 [bacterium]|jgi:hypothetical protein|nr:hypothetical protein [bacterium]
MACLLLVILTPLALLGALLWRLYSLEAPRIPLPPAPPPRPGLWYCSHRADKRLPFQHLFIRITPTDQGWAGRRPDLFIRRDAAGSSYCTLGAGPRAGKLFLEFNRGFDLGDPVGFEEPIPCADALEENGRISALLEAADAYAQALDFTAWSRISGRGYNCNSMIRALAGRAGLPRPRFGRHLLLCPGLGRGLPPSAFAKREGKD